MKSIRLDLPLLLPEVSDARDACVHRLQALLSPRRGVTRTHIAEQGGRTVLCLHYDPDTLTVDDVRQLAQAAGAQVTERYGHRVWPLRAIAAEDAGRRIEGALGSIEGVIAASVSLPAQIARVEFERARFRPERVEEVLRDVGAGPVPEPETRPSWYVRNRELAWSLAAGILLATGFTLTLTGAPTTLVVAVYAISYLFGAFDLVRHALGSVRRGQFLFDIDLLMLLAAIGAAVLGEWAEGAFLLFLFSLAHALEHYALGRARASIRALADLAPPIARVQRSSSVDELPVAQVQLGDRVIVRPAERIPVDGRIVAGRSAVNQAPITGESVPVDKAENDDVYAGTINGEGALTIETTKAAGDRTLDRVIKLVEEAQTQKAPTQVFTDRFERVFVPLVLVGDVLVMIVPPALGVWDWSTSFYRAMALLVASSPCALALGTPAAVLAGIAQAARRGVLVKGGMHLENLGTVRAIALDKTGTLTTGQPEVTDVVPSTGITDAELLQVSASVEKQSQHPLAQAVVRRAEAAGVPLEEAAPLESITGRGVRSQLNGQPVEIGNVRLFEESGRGLDAGSAAAVGRLQAGGRSIMIVRMGERWLGVLGLADRPRNGVRDVLDQLRRTGVKRIVMLTGDHRLVGEAIGKEVGVDEVRGELLPEDKVTAIQALVREYGSVAMVGDGVNDAPALAQATVGIAMGAAGTATALETADVALMADDLGRLPFAIGLSRQAKAIIRQNLYLSLAVIGALILATTTGIFGIGAAVLVHEGSTLVVIANALRLLMYE
ncbi:MAG: heavy metal translocating P-type ATPase, partial [Vicinamibacterales bacterium]